MDRGRTTRRMRHALLATTVTAAALLAAGCGGDDDSSGSSAGKQRTLVVYSGREKELAEPLYAAFEKDTGIKVEARYGESPAMASQLQEEGDETRADVFYSQDAGAIGSVNDMLETLPEKTIAAVPEQFREPSGKWTGVTGRARTLIYNTDRVKESDLPDSVLDVAGEEWASRVGVAPTNSSFIAFVSAMRQAIGEDDTSKFLKALDVGEARTYEKNSQIAEAVASGEVDAGLVNHYYLYELLGEQPDAPVKNHFFADGDVGNFVNVSAVGVLKGAENADEAQEFVEYLLDEGQHFIVDEAEEREYPLVSGIVADNPRYKELPPLESIVGPEVDLSSLGDALKPTVELIQASGLAG